MEEAQIPNHVQQAGGDLLPFCCIQKTILHCRIGCSRETFEAMVERRTLNTLLAIMDNPDHISIMYWTDSRVPSVDGSHNSAVTVTDHYKDILLATHKKIYSMYLAQFLHSLCIRQTGGSCRLCHWRQPHILLKRNRQLLILNLNKTKELVIDIRRKDTSDSSIYQ